MSVALGASQIEYELQLGGDNQVANWETFPPLNPAYVQGSPLDDTVVTVAVDPVITWDALVTVLGSHEGGPGDGYVTNGAANLVFSLEIRRSCSPPTGRAEYTSSARTASLRC